MGYDDLEHGKIMSKEEGEKFAICALGRQDSDGHHQGGEEDKERWKVAA